MLTVLLIFEAPFRNFNHELKKLLTTPPHHISMLQPLYILTENCRFGSNVGVCGFIVEYLPLGTLTDGLQHANPIQGKIELKDQFR